GLARRDSAGCAEEEGIDQVSGLLRHLIQGEAAAIKNANVAELHVFDVVARNAAQDGAVARIGVVNNDVGDIDAVDATDLDAFGCAHAAAEARKNGGVGDLTHGDVRDGDVLDAGAVHGFE